jgi:hypothetical protein
MIRFSVLIASAVWPDASYALAVDDESVNSDRPFRASAAEPGKKRTRAHSNATNWRRRYDDLDESGRHVVNEAGKKPLAW